MAIFFFLFTILLFSVIKLKNSNRWGIFLIFLMAFICAFRGINVGSDTINYYMNNFSGDASVNDIASGTLVGMEFGFQLISRYIAQMGLSSRWCVYILAIITYVYLSLAAVRFYKLLGAKVVFVAFLYFVMGYYAMTFNISRQMAATSIILYGYSFLFQDKRKNIHFFISLLFASSLHISSLIYLLFFFVRYLNLSKIKPELVIVSSIGVFLFVQLFKDVCLNFIMTKSEVLTLYSHYMQETEELTVSIAGFLFEFFKLALSLYVYFRLNRFINRYFMNLYLASIIIDILFGAFYGNIYRVSFGFVIIQMIAYATFLSKMGDLPTSRFVNIDKKLIFPLIVLIYGYESLSSLYRGAYDIIPYYITL